MENFSLHAVVLKVADAFQRSAESLEQTAYHYRKFACEPSVWDSAKSENGMLLGLMDGIGIALGEDYRRFIEDSASVVVATRRFDTIFHAIKAQHGTYVPYNG